MVDVKLTKKASISASYSSKQLKSMVDRLGRTKSQAKKLGRRGLLLVTGSGWWMYGPWSFCAMASPIFALFDL